MCFRDRLLCCFILFSDNEDEDLVDRQFNRGRSGLQLCPVIWWRECILAWTKWHYDHTFATNVVRESTVDRYPSTIIIHIGSNDIFEDSTTLIRKQMMELLTTTRKLLPRIIWSDMLPRFSKRLIDRFH